VPLPAETKDLSALPPQLAGYAVIRRMNLLDADNKNAEAISVGKSAMREVPSLALALALAQRLVASGDSEGATWVVRGAADNADTSPSNWELICEAASFLAANKKSAEAIDLYTKLFAVDTIPAAVRSTWLGEARRAALEGGETGQAAEWKEEMGQAVEKPAGAKP
jgi:predicted Zn-dependent protease